MNWRKGGESQGYKGPEKKSLDRDSHFQPEKNSVVGSSVQRKPDQQIWNFDKMEPDRRQKEKWSKREKLTPKAWTDFQFS